jgi:alpha-glucosidase
VWTLGNHDLDRYATRWAGGDPGLARCALMLLLTLRGTPVLYYGDELALPQADIPPERVVDPAAKRDPNGIGRDGARTPMPWSADPGAGFTTPGVEPWLPWGEVAGLDVASQREDRGSALWLSRDLVALRRAEPDLRTGAYREVSAEGEVWVYRRGDRLLVALNLGAEEATVPARGVIAIGTRRERDGEAVSGALALGPREGVVVRRTTPRSRGARQARVRAAVPRPKSRSARAVATRGA